MGRRLVSWIDITVDERFDISKLSFAMWLKIPLQFYCIRNILNV